LSAQLPLSFLLLNAFLRPDLTLCSLRCKDSRLCNSWRVLKILIFFASQAVRLQLAFLTTGHLCSLRNAGSCSYNWMGRNWYFADRFDEERRHFCWMGEGRSGGSDGSFLLRVESVSQCSKTENPSNRSCHHQCYFLFLCLAYRLTKKFVSGE